MAAPRFVVVGGGRAAVSAAQTLRTEGFDGEIVVVGEEELAPYERPPLSKTWLTDSASRESLLLEEPSWYDEHDVELLLGTRAEALDAGSATLRLSGGARLRYDRLLIATGGRPRRLPGANGDRIRYLRTVADAEALRELMVPGARLVVLGGGFIGCEVASTARAVGMEVTILEMAPTVLARVLGDELGGVFSDLHRERGVDLRTGQRVEAVEETAGGLAVRVADLAGDHGTVECSALVVAIGLDRPTGFLDGSGVLCDNGVLVDEHAETSVPGVFAAGDVAASAGPGHGRRLRIEHHDNAAKQGRVAARNMLGGRAVHGDVPWFWSDQYEHSLQMVGSPEGHDEVVLRGSVADRSFAAFHLSRGRVLSVLTLDRGRDLVAGRRLIAAGAQVAAAQLADESVELRSLLPRRGSPGGEAA